MLQEFATPAGGLIQCPEIKKRYGNMAKIIYCRSSKKVTSRIQVRTSNLTF